MKFLLPLLRNNLLQLSHANQLRYADTKSRTKTIILYVLIAAILMGLLAYLIYSLKIIYSIAWPLEEVVTELVVPMALICVIFRNFLDTPVLQPRRFIRRSVWKGKRRSWRSLMEGIFCFEMNGKYC